jgi:hypothetical protein
MSVYSLVMSGSTPLGNLCRRASPKAGARRGFHRCGGVIVVALLPLYYLRKRKG